VAVEAYGRALTLDAAPHEYYLGRASARYSLDRQALPAVLQDLDQATARHPDAARLPADDTAKRAGRRELAALYYAQGNVLELLADQDAGEARTQRYAKAEAAHEQARSLAPADPRHPLAVARTLRKRARHLPDAQLRAQQFARAAELLQTARELNPKMAEIDNELGELELSRGDVVAARRAFDRAVQAGGDDRRAGNLYRYYCNVANAYTREPGDQAVYQAGLTAAQKASACQPQDDAAAQYYRGLALWRLGRTPEAREALDLSLTRQPQHLGALLARCQIVFEQEPGPPAAQLRQAYQDVDLALRLSRQGPTTPEDLAKAYYVHSLSWLKQHMAAQGEEPLANCQADLIEAVKSSPAYAQAARKLFAYAAGFPWQNAQFREQSQRLQREFETLIAAQPPPP
jgi:Flp pilus assembly protein TadD